MARVFQGKIAIPGDQIEAYLLQCWRKRFCCQASTVRGWTNARASCQPDQTRESHARNRRSAGQRRGRGTVCLYTASGCWSARILRCMVWRDWNRDAKGEQGRNDRWHRRAPQQNRVSSAVQKRWARMHVREAHVKNYNRFGFSGTTGIKQRYRPTCGFKTFATAGCFYRVVDEIRAFLRPQSHRNQPLTLAQRRCIHRERFAHLMGTIAAA